MLRHKGITRYRLKIYPQTLLSAVYSLLSSRPAATHPLPRPPLLQLRLFGTLLSFQGAIAYLDSFIVSCIFPFNANRRETMLWWNRVRFLNAKEKLSKKMFYCQIMNLCYNYIFLGPCVGWWTDWTFWADCWVLTSQGKSLVCCKHVSSSWHLTATFENWF